MLQDVSSNKVFVYMKGVPTAPQCGFSNAVCRILDAYGVISDKQELRSVLIEILLRVPGDKHILCHKASVFPRSSRI